MNLRNILITMKKNNKPHLRRAPDAAIIGAVRDSLAIFSRIVAWRGYGMRYPRFIYEGIANSRSREEVIGRG